MTASNAIVFTANSGTGQLTMTAHGLVTGDGPGLLRAHAGLIMATTSPTQQYFAIRIDADHIKLATSRANALASTAISFTDNGSGTLYFLSQLPYQPPRVLAPLTQVFSTEINAQFAAAVAAANPHLNMLDRFVEKTVASLPGGAGFGSGNDPQLNGVVGVDASARYAYALACGSSYLRQGSANNKIQLAPGTLYQKRTSTGLVPSFVAYTFFGVEEWTLANGDATNPRIDLLQMSLAWDSTLSISTVSMTVKQGTPAASPQIPDPDSGFVPVGFVMVGHGWTTGGNAPIFGIDTTDTNNAVVYDCRMPLGVRAYRVDPVLYKLETAWALASNNQQVTASSGTNRLFAICPSHAGRLIAIDVRRDTTIAAGAITLGDYRVAFGSAPSTSYIKGNTWSEGFNAGGNLRRCRLTDFEGAHNPAAGPTILQSATNLIGVPMWTSGLRLPRAASTEFGWLAASVQNQTNATAIADMVFWLAEGL